MSKPTVASLSLEIAELKALVAQLVATKAVAPSPAPVAPSAPNVVLWKSDAQRRFWREKACYALSREQPEARSFPADVVERKAEALFCAPRAAH